MHSPLHDMISCSSSSFKSVQNRLNLLKKKKRSKLGCDLMGNLNVSLVWALGQPTPLSPKKLVISSSCGGSSNSSSSSGGRAGSSSSSSGSCSSNCRGGSSCVGGSSSNSGSSSFSSNNTVDVAVWAEQFEKYIKLCFF